MLREIVLPSLSKSEDEIAQLLGVTRENLYRFLNEEGSVTPAMAVRLGNLCGNGPGLWTRMQAAHGEDPMQGYIALIYRPDPDAAGAIAVTFPDVPGCATCGKTFAEAIEMGREALSGHLALMRADGDAIPVPRPWEAITADPEFAEEVRGTTPHIIVPR